MKTQILHWDDQTASFGRNETTGAASFVVYAGPNEIIESEVFQTALNSACPNARLLGCTAEQVILADALDEGRAHAVVVELEHSTVRLARSDVSVETSYATGQTLGRELAADDLVAVYILCDSLNVEGADLVEGLRSQMPPGTPISGGLAADGSNFTRTLAAGDCPPQERLVAALGFYGDALEVGQGCAHGWDDFGPPRQITRAKGNQLFELDGRPALEIYKSYLAEEAANLPGSALRFPLLIWDPIHPESQVVRTVLDIDETSQSLVFASAIPEGWQARLMRGVFEHLADGAREAGKQAAFSGTVCSSGGRVALMSSCVGRNLLLGVHTEDELEAVMDGLNDDYTSFGFYTHGEISLSAEGGFCGLHNQTMTVMTLQETF